MAVKISDVNKKHDDFVWDEIEMQRQIQEFDTPLKFIYHTL